VRHQDGIARPLTSARATRTLRVFANLFALGSAAGAIAPAVEPPDGSKFAIHEGWSTSRFHCVSVEDTFALDQGRADWIVGR